MIRSSLRLPGVKSLRSRRWICLKRQKKESRNWWMLQLQASSVWSRITTKALVMQNRRPSLTMTFWAISNWWTFLIAMTNAICEIKHLILTFKILPWDYLGKCSINCWLTYRSEDIELYKVTLHKDSDWNIMNELGQLNSLHFIDLNRDLQPYELKFTNNIKAAENSLRKIE